jgi:hypothetical protein
MNYVIENRHPTPLGKRCATTPHRSVESQAVCWLFRPYSGYNIAVGSPVRVLNIHERELPVSAERVGALIDSLSSREDALWPRQSWPRMAFDRPLSVGAVGGHGPVRYFVEAYTPGRSIRFCFTGPRGFDGYHEFAVLSLSAQSCVLRHTLEMTTRGPAVLSWPIAFRPMHDALLEDSLALAQASLGQPPRVQKWSAWVRVVRCLVSKGKSRAQVSPKPPLVRTATGQPGRL